jgi:hypothetical protein
MIPAVQAALHDGLTSLRHPWRWARAHLSHIVVALGAMGGAVLFFLYCQLRWGHWDMYMLTQSAGWGITPDYLAVLKPSSYRWVVPALNNPTEASQLCMSLTAVLFVLVAICELLPAVRHRTNWQQRMGFYFAAAIVYYISVSGVACVDMESMLRYQFCTHALIVLAFLHFLRQFRLPPAPVRALGVAAVVLLSAAGLSLQGWYVWNFTRGNWVA